MAIAGMAIWERHAIKARVSVCAGIVVAQSEAPEAPSFAVCAKH
jgi:hypothetical protein